MEKEEITSTSDNPIHAVQKPERFTYRIPIRMTREERAIIGKKAHESGLSVSRYLVYLATVQSDLRPEDRGRLKRLQSYFDEASKRLRNLSALPLFNEHRSSAARQAVSRLEEVLSVLEALSAEINRRLS